MRRCFFKLFVVTFLFVGCASHAPMKKNQSIELVKLLQVTSPYANSHEVKQLTYDIFDTTEELSKAFEMTSPPQYHNFLVNIGLREKGLCYHWSDALYLHFMQSKNYPSFEFHLVGANIGEYWTEHNSLVIVGKGRSIESGVIIDPWRNAGALYFSQVKDDSTYEWIHRPSRGCL